MVIFRSFQSFDYQPATGSIFYISYFDETIMQDFKQHFSPIIKVAL
jgi:hypothetical protein